MAKPMRFDQHMIDDYIEMEWWDKTSPTEILEQNAAKYPQKEAVCDSRNRYTWSQFNRMVNRAALKLLELGLSRDQAVIVQVPTSAMQMLLCMAFHKAGLLSCFAPMTFRQTEITHLVRTLKAVAFITVGQYRNFNYFEMGKQIAQDIPDLKHLLITGDDVPSEALSVEAMLQDPIEERYPNDYLHSYNYSPFELAHVVLSSGSTGMPKCIEHTGATCKAGGWGIVERAKLTSDDVIGIIAPLSGGPGFQTWWAALQLGAKACLLERFTPGATLELIQREGVTFLSAIPTQVVRILRETDVSKYGLSSLRVVRTGAAAFDPAMAKETEEKLGCKVSISGGSQETHSFACTSVDDTPEVRTETLGKPFPKTEIKIVDSNEREVARGEVGELRVRGAASSSGYFRDVEATKAAWGELGKNGWYRTGDLARLDQEGNLILVGRKKEMILRGGQNIFPREIEEMLITHPKVKIAAVVGFPDQVLGERACACVVPEQGERPLFEEIVSFLSEKGLAVHKLPERLEVMDDLPMLAEGQKIDRRRLTVDIARKVKDESSSQQ